jgi:2-haloacid dehalogenase
LLPPTNGGLSIPTTVDPLTNDGAMGSSMLQHEAGRPVVVFDLGGVLIDWNPRYLYRRLFDDEAAMERFLAEVCNDDWNVQQDAGRPFAEAVEVAAALHPDLRLQIEAYWRRWDEMLAGPIPASVGVLEELAAAGEELHALTNWSAETFPIARERYRFLDLFRTIVVSAEERVAKPDARIFEILLTRIGRPAGGCIFIDDSPKNVAAAAALGFDAIRFEDGDQLRGALIERGFPLAR